MTKIDAVPNSLINSIPNISSSEDLASLDFGQTPDSESGMALSLVDSGLLTSEQLSKALTKRAESECTFLEALEELELIDQKNRSVVIASKLGIPVIHILNLEVDARILRRIPAPLALKYQVFPIGEVDGKLVVAVTDPSNTEVTRAVNFAVGNAVHIVVAPAQDIVRLIDRYFMVLEEQDLIDELSAEAREALPVQQQQLLELEKKARQKPIVKLVDSLLRRAVSLNTSDINIRPDSRGAAIYFRIDGKMHWQREIAPDLVDPIICRIKILGTMNIAERRLPQDGHAVIKHGGQMIDMRISVIPMVTGESVVIRILDKSKGVMSIDELDLFDADLFRLKRVLDNNHGIFLVTGPTGSGKSTTLYAVIAERMKSDAHIITVEDPVEYQMEGVEQIQTKPEIGYTFPEALRHILRHDPDELLIGEMRDSETAEIGIKASLTGHFVMSTLHTNDAASAISRLLNMGIEPFLLSSSIVGILAQRLVRKICTHCRVEDDRPSNICEYFQLSETERFYYGEGCEECLNSGYKGRMMVAELIEVTAALRELIDSGASTAALRKQAVDDGMQPLTSNALELARQGVTTLEEVFAVKLE